MSSYDYVIVGAGSAGCVLAHRLSEDPANRVLLLEAGGSHRALRIRAPGLYNLLWRTSYDWNFYTEPQANAQNRRMYWPRGKVLGGTSCLNAMVYIRGHRTNYDEWRDLGNPGWGYDDVLPFFKKSEDFRGPPSDFHGRGGLLTVTPARAPEPVTTAFIEATATHLSVRKTDDFNGAEQEGVGLFHHTIRDNERWSTARAFLDPARGHAGLTIADGALATGVTFADGRATGVRYRRKGREEHALATREVLLAGGSIGSPHLLLLSGVGPADQLREHGIAEVLDLPGVGENLQDHLLSVVAWTTLMGGSQRLSIPALLGWMARYVVGRSGVISKSPVEAGGFVKTGPEQPRPDLQFHFCPFGPDRPNTDEKRDVIAGREFMILPSLIYPKSRGSVRLRSADPAHAPLIEPRYLSDEADMDLLFRGTKLAREIAHTAPLSAYRGEPRVEAASATSDDEVRADIRHRMNTIFHPVGTCKMGADDLAVVDHELRVRGVEGLRVVDGSVMPTIVGGNTNAPIVMIAEKAADAILRAR